MKKINIAELLKDCPKGMEFNCTMYDNVKLDSIDKGKVTFPIRILREDGNFITLTKYGQYIDASFAKCVIFPKGKTTWEGFVPPCNFKDGDIVFYNNTIAIFKEWGDETLFRTYVVTYLHCDSFIDVNVPLFGTKVRKEIRLATDEEKQKLFQTIENNGYRWNAETKTLEKLVEPIENKEINNFNVLPGLYKCVHRMFDGTPDGKLLFEIGNIYKCLSKHDRAEFEVSYGHSVYLEDPVVCKHFIPFENQDEFELVHNKLIEPKFKVGG